MSLSLSQKIDKSMNTLQRLIVSFGITDETFSVASIQDGVLSFPFMLGFILVPIIGWTSGTLVGETLMNFLPTSIQNAMGIALYGMFLAIIVPASAKSKPILEVVLVSATMAIVFYYIPLFSVFSSGLKLIMATLFGAVYGALRYPVKEEITS